MSPSDRRRRTTRLEPVADAAHRVDAHGVVELLADLRDVHVDRARVAEPVVAPHAVEDLLAAQREPGRSARKRSRSNSLVVNVDRRRSSTRTSRRPTSIVDVADLDDLGGGAAVGAAQHRLHPRDELGGRERLGEVVVGAELEAEHAVDLAVAGGEEDHRDRRRLAEPAAHLEPVDVGQADVEHDQSGPVVGDRLERRPRRSRPCTTRKPSRLR